MTTPPLENPSPSAATSYPTGMRSLERKLFANSNTTPGSSLYQPEWAEVRVVMRERESFRRALEQIASGRVEQRGSLRPSFADAATFARAALEEAESDV